MNEADQHWQNRLDEGELRAALAAWERQVAADPRDVDSWLMLSRGRFLLADGFLEARKSQRGATRDLVHMHDAGAEAALAGLAALSPVFVSVRKKSVTMKEAVKSLGAAEMPLVFWWAQNTALWASAKGMMTVVKNHEMIFRVMERVAELSPDIWYGGPARYFGAVYCLAPAVIGGDLEKGREFFEASLRRAPDFFATHELYARLYALPAKQRELRERLLDHVRNTPIDVLPEVVPEQTLARRRAVGG